MECLVFSCFFFPCKLWNVAFLSLFSIPMVLGVILCLLVFDVGGYNAWCELLLHYLHGVFELWNKEFYCI
jgi:hypothetical protein